MLQKQRLINSLTTRVLRKEGERRALLEEREKHLASTRKEAEELVHQASSHPQRTYILLQIMAINLEGDEVVPDAFEDQKIQEHAVLLWRRLSHLVEKCQSLMTQEQLAQCQQCLIAFHIEYWIRETAIRLEAYEEYQRLKPQWESSQRKLRQTTLLRRLLFPVIIGVALVSFLAYARSVGFDLAANKLVWWVIGAGGIAGLVFPVTEALLLKDREAIEHRLLAAGQKAEINNTDFWDTVREKFNGVPSFEQLDQIWADQEAIIDALFAETTNGGGNAEL